MPPAVPRDAPQIPPHWQGLMWGLLPFGTSIFAILMVLIPEKRRQEYAQEYPINSEETLVTGRMAS